MTLFEPLSHALDTRVMLAKGCFPHLAVSASLEYQFSRIQGVSNSADRAGRDTSWTKMISAGVVRFWMWEMRAEMRASGADEEASMFQVTRTNLLS